MENEWWWVWLRMERAAQWNKAEYSGPQKSWGLNDLNYILLSSANTLPFSYHNEITNLQTFRLSTTRRTFFFCAHEAHGNAYTIIPAKWRFPLVLWPRPLYGHRVQYQAARPLY